MTDDLKNLDQDKNLTNNEVIHTYKNRFEAKKVELKENYTFYPTNIFFNISSKILMGLTTFFEFFSKKIFFGFKVVGKKNFKKNKKGNFIICNHVHPKDVFMLATALYPSRVYITSLQSNLGFFLASWYFRVSALVPIPEERRLLRKFKEETTNTIKKGKNIVFFAEGSLELYSKRIREFKSGVFHFAYEANANILPMVYTFHKPRGLYKLYKKKPCIRLNILPVYKMEDLSNKKESIEKANKDVHKIISDYFNKNNEVF